MARFIPVFVVASKVGMFLAKNPKAGRSHLPCIWTRNRDEAERFDNWLDAAQFGMTLPLAAQRSAAVVDQDGSIWNDDRARKAKVYYPPKKPAAKELPNADGAAAEIAPLAKAA